MKATSLDNSQVHSFLFLVTKSYTLFMNVVLCLCCWHFSWHLLTDMAVMFTNINHYFKWGLVNMLTWQSSANMLTYIYIYKGAFSSQDPRNLWLCLVCFVNNFDLPLWSRMYMLWFNFILGVIFISHCFKLIIIHYHTPKQREIKFESRIKLNHNIYT